MNAIEKKPEKPGDQPSQPSIFSVDCVTLFGDRLSVPVDKLILRASAYAVVPHDNSLLLIQMRSTGKYYLPGGGSRTGERLEAAVKREVKEETGVSIEVHRLLHFQETFFYYDPFDEAYHSLQFFYLCTPITIDVISNVEVHDQEAENPQWVPINTLAAVDFQDHGPVIMQLIHSAFGDVSSRPRGINDAV